MEQINAEHVILTRLYTSYFQDRSEENLHAICEELAMDNTSFWNIVDYMSHQGLIKAWTMGGNYIILSPGVLQAEKLGVVPEGLIKENQHARTVILDKLAAVYEKGGSIADAYIETLSGETGIEVNVLVNNLQVLEDLGYIESVSIGSYKIKYIGLEAVARWEISVGFVKEFEDISSLKPHPRGQALQKLLAKVIEKNGWFQEEGARTSHEEMDIVIHKEREYFLIESKWEKEPIQAGVVRELYGKLGNRIGVQGIVISMSGYTEGALQQAEEYASNRVILFFGPEDIKQLIHEQASFDILLNDKYQHLITKRKILYD